MICHGSHWDYTPVIKRLYTTTESSFRICAYLMCLYRLHRANTFLCGCARWRNHVDTGTYIGRAWGRVSSACDLCRTHSSKRRFGTVSGLCTPFGVVCFSSRHAFSCEPYLLVFLSDTQDFEKSMCCHFSLSDFRSAWTAFGWPRSSSPNSSEVLFWKRTRA